jgi:hypothetical protein
MPVTLDMTTAEPIQAAAPVTLDMSTAQALGKTAPNKGYQTPVEAASEIAEMIGGAAKSIAKISGPNVMYELLRKNFPHLNLPSALGMPNANEVMANGLAMIAGGAEGAEGEAAEGAAVPKAEAAISATTKPSSILEHPAVKPWVDWGKAKVIPNTGLIKTVIKSAQGMAESAPEAPVAGQPIPTTNGVPWGSKIPETGPAELWGKTIPPAPQPAAPPAPTSTANLTQTLNDALGGKPLKPHVPLRQQLQTATPKASTLPTGFTPVESTVLKGYKYDAAAQEFTAITQNGQTYTHGEVTPDQVAAFESADSQGRAWTQEIRNNSPLVRKNGVPVKPVQRAVEPETTESTSEDRLGAQLQESLRQARASRALKDLAGQ